MLAMSKNRGGGATIKTILFDLDGTLVDSAPDLWRAMNHVLALRGYPLLALEQVRHLVGDGARVLLARGFWGEQAEPPKQDGVFEEAVVEFLSYYQEHLTDFSRPYPGVLPTLQALKDQGLSMAVVTNKPEMLARRMVAQLGLDAFFVGPVSDSSPGLLCVVGGDTLASRKPSAEPLLYALSQQQGSVDQAIMVGDSATDVHAARAAGCPVVWMRYGYNRGATMDALNPDWVLDTFAQLPQIVG